MTTDTRRTFNAKKLSYVARVRRARDVSMRASTAAAALVERISPESPLAFPRMSTLAADMGGVSVDTARRAVRELAKVEAVTITPVRYPDGNNGAHRITPVLEWRSTGEHALAGTDATPSWQHCDPPPGSTATPPPSKSATHNPSNLNPSRENPTTELARARAREGGGSAPEGDDHVEGDKVAEPDVTPEPEPGDDGMQRVPDGEGEALSSKSVAVDWETADARTRTAWGQVKAHDRKHGTDLFRYIHSDMFEQARTAVAEGRGRALDTLLMLAEYEQRQGGTKGTRSRPANPLLEGARMARRARDGGEPEMRDVTPNDQPSDAAWDCWVHLEANGSGWNGPGPPPGKPGTRVPTHILDKHGYSAQPKVEPAPNPDEVRKRRFRDDQGGAQPAQARHGGQTAGEAASRATPATQPATAEPKPGVDASSIFGEHRAREAAQQRANDALTNLMQTAGTGVAMLLDSDDFDAACEAEMKERGSAARTLAERAKAKEAAQ